MLTLFQRMNLLDPEAEYFTVLDVDYHITRTVVKHEFRKNSC